MSSYEPYRADDEMDRGSEMRYDDDNLEEDSGYAGGGTDYWDVDSIIADHQVRLAGFRDRGTGEPTCRFGPAAETVVLFSGRRAWLRSFTRKCRG